MDVEEQVKINELARELQSKGLAPSSCEASTLAKCIISGDKKVGPGPESTISSNDDKPANSIDKEMIEIMIERSERKLGNELSKMNEQIRLFSNQLKFIADEFRMFRSSVKISNQNAVPDTVIKPPVQENKGQTTINSEPIKSSNSSLDSSNAVKKDDEQIRPEDVAVDKIFYFGQK